MITGMGQQIRNLELASMYMFDWEMNCSVLVLIGSVHLESVRKRMIRIKHGALRWTRIHRLSLNQ